MPIVKEAKKKKKRYLNENGYQEKESTLQTDRWKLYNLSMKSFVIDNSVLGTDHFTVMFWREKNCIFTNFCFQCFWCWSITTKFWCGSLINCCEMNSFPQKFKVNAFFRPEFPIRHIYMMRIKHWSEFQSLQWKKKKKVLQPK